MKFKVSIIALFLAFSASAVVEIGEQAPNLCYTDIDQQEFCLDDFKGTVAVLVYNAGWCPPCNSEMSELAPASVEFANQPVTFVSISGNGWSHGSDPSVQFLKEWKAKHGIPDKLTSGISFVVSAGPGDFGKNFIAPPLYIPNTAILDQQGRLAAKGVGMSVSEMFGTVRKLVSENSE